METTRTLVSMGHAVRSIEALRERDPAVRLANEAHASRLKRFEVSKYSRPKYDHGDAVVHRHAHGSHVSRMAIGPTRESVEEAHTDFVSNHPFSETSKPDTSNPNDHFTHSVYDAVRGPNGHWTKRWMHWNEFT